MLCNVQEKNAMYSDTVIIQLVGVVVEYEVLEPSNHYKMLHIVGGFLEYDYNDIT